MCGYVVEGVYLQGSLAPPKADAAAPLALEDAVEQVLAIADILEVPPLLGDGYEHGAYVQHLTDEVRRLGPDSTPIYLAGRCVRFDGCSHSSGKQRGYIACHFKDDETLAFVLFFRRGTATLDLLSNREQLESKAMSSLTV